MQRKGRPTGKLLLSCRLTSSIFGNVLSITSRGTSLETNKATSHTERNPARAARYLRSAPCTQAVELWDGSVGRVVRRRRKLWGCGSNRCEHVSVAEDEPSIVVHSLLDGQELLQVGERGFSQRRLSFRNVQCVRCYDCSDCVPMWDPKTYEAVEGSLLTI